jgi:large-conductance mechanosensitive channel
MAETPTPPQKTRKRAKKVVRKMTKTVNTVAPVHPLKGFADFIRGQGVVGLAIGFVLGAQAKVLVDSITLSFINPLLGLILPGQGDLVSKKLTVTVGEKSAIFTYGAFLNVFISFVAVLVILFLIFKYLKLDRLEKDK